ncbi:CRTAC1 family protein [Candidatus Binatia bacterium]|nr:CRTAC1 family protein [Candidatus Binatia bacterium]
MSSSVRNHLSKTIAIALLLAGLASVSAAGDGAVGLEARFTSVGMGPGVACYGPGTLPPAWGDYDGDGDPDLPLYHNDGDGTFSEIPGFRDLLANGNYHGAAWADYDRDGDLDLTMLPYATGATLLLQNQGDGTFTDVAQTLGMDFTGYGETAAWGDYDGDGDVDLFAPFYSHLPPFQSFLFRNEGDGTFTEVAEDAGVALPDIPERLRPEGAHWADWDDDGRLDLYCAWHLFLNDGDGTFTDVRADVGLPQLFDEGSMFVDFDNDADLDLYVRALTGAKLFRNDAGAMVDVSTAAGIPPVAFLWGDSWADVNHDGYLDLLVMQASAAALLLLNQGDGTFAEDLAFTALDLRYDNSAWADYDRDGDLDLVTGTGCHGLFRNELDGEEGFADSYLRVSARDARGRQTQHGATIRLRRVDQEGHGVQTRIVDGGSGYLSQSEYNAHFGVAPDGVHALEVVFPSGDVRTAVNSAVNPGLGSIVPRDLVDKTVVVERDGWVTIDGNAWGPPAASVLTGGSMELDDDGDGVPDGWKRRGATRSSRVCQTEVLAATHLGTCGFRFVGATNRPAALLRQNASGLSGRAGDRLKLGVWVRGRRLPADARLQIKLRLAMGDVVTDVTSLVVDGSRFPWSGLASTLVATAPYDAARVKINFRATSGWVAIDDVALTIEQDASIAASPS